MSLSRLLMVILLATCMILSTSAQEEPSKKKGNLEIGQGFNAFGPKQQMANHMNDNYFGRDNLNWFWGEIEYPRYNFVGFTALITYSHYLDSLNRLGILVHYSYWGTVVGNSGYVGHLSVLFSNISVVLLYTYDLSPRWEYQAGPALMINKGYNYTPPHEIGDTENYKKISPGLLFGLNLKMWDSKIFYGKFGLSFLIAMPSKMGPYTAINEDDFRAQTLPEVKIRFGHLNLLFVFGFHL